MVTGHNESNLKCEEGVGRKGQGCNRQQAHKGWGTPGRAGVASYWLTVCGV